MCWLQIEDVVDGCGHFDHQYSLCHQTETFVSNIQLLSPSSSRQNHDVTNITNTAQPLSNISFLFCRTVKVMIMKTNLLNWKVIILPKSSLQRSLSTIIYYRKNKKDLKMTFTLKSKELFLIFVFEITKPLENTINFDKKFASVFALILEHTKRCPLSGWFLYNG